MPTIPQMEKAFLKHLQALGFTEYKMFGGSWMGDRQVMGKFLSARLPTYRTLSRDKVSGAEALVRKYYGPVFRTKKRYHVGEYKDWNIERHTELVFELEPLPPTTRGRNKKSTGK